MDRIPQKKLHLDKETLRVLSSEQLEMVEGGMMAISKGGNCETDPTYNPNDTNCVDA